MQIDSELKQKLQQINDWLNEQVWFQQLKSKWDELDPDSQRYAKYGALASSLLVVILIMMSTLSGVYGLRDEVRAKREILTLLQQANDEIRLLQNKGGSASSGEDKELKEVDWREVFTGQAGAAGIESASLEVSSAKAGEKTDKAKEFLFDMSIKHINIKQLVRFVFNLENSGRPIKLRKLTVDTEGGEGYLNASVAVSAFEILTASK